MPAAAMEREQIFVQDVDKIRASQPLDNFMPEGLPTFDLLDAACLDLCNKGVLRIVDTSAIRRNMKMMKDQGLPRAAFKSLAADVLSPLVHKGVKAASVRGEVKAAVSLRAGNAFTRYFEDEMPGCQIGFAKQTRSEDDPTICISDNEKLGTFKGKFALALDVMLATGGSLTAMIGGSEGVMERGAEGVIVIAAFATPQGVMEVSRIPGVQQIIVPPLEAGLTAPDENRKHGGFIVGGIGDMAMLGDFGDRYYGPVQHKGR